MPTGVSLVPTRVEPARIDSALGIGLHDRAGRRRYRRAHEHFIFTFVVDEPQAFSLPSFAEAGTRSACSGGAPYVAVAVSSLLASGTGRSRVASVAGGDMHDREHLCFKRLEHRRPAFPLNAHTTRQHDAGAVEEFRGGTELLYHRVLSTGWICRRSSTRIPVARRTHRTRAQAGLSSGRVGEWLMTRRCGRLRSWRSCLQTTVTSS